MWTPALTERWQRDGWRPKAGVWTAGQTATFLHQVREHQLYALFHLVALRGLRRGEAAAWSLSPGYRRSRCTGCGTAP